MKIVFINNYLYRRGGVETLMFDQIEQLKRHGHDVAVFTRHHKKNIQSDYEEYFAPTFEYTNISGVGKLSAGINLIYSYKTRQCLSKLLEDFRPDIIHCHNIYGRLTTSVIDAARQMDIPLISSLHDYKMICPSYLMSNKGRNCEKCVGGRFYFCLLNRCHKEKFIPSLIYTIETYFNVVFKKYAWAKYFICPSRFLLQKHHEAGIPKEKLIQISNSVNTDRYKPNYTQGKYILFVGRISKEKGVLTLIKAVKGLSVPLKIVGEGPMGEECKKYVQKNNIHNVHFEGHRSGSELADLYEKAIFLVVPSEWYEVFGLIILEAFASGKPVIASNIGGIPELVLEKETGLLFEPGDNIELREKIDHLLSNPSLIAKMGEKAREKVEEEYTTELHYSNLMDLYKKAIS